MKKIIYSAFIAFFIVFVSCSDKQEFEDIYYNGVNPEFSETDIELGSLLAKSLRKTAKAIKKNKIDLRNSSAIEKISLETTLDVIGKKYAIPKEEMLRVKEEAISYNKKHQYSFKSSAKSDYSSLTIMQQRALNAIEQARVNSKSAIAYMDKLAAINKRVDDLVPEGERELLHQIIAFSYYEVKEINNLVRAGFLPGKAEARPKKVKIGTELAFNDTSLLSLTKMAHADGEIVIELEEIVIVATGNTDGDGISLSDWYLLQDMYGTTYQDGSNDNYDDYNTNTSDDEGESWWDCMQRTAGKKIGRGIAGGFIVGFISGGLAGAAGGTVVVPVVGTVVGGAGVAVIGGTVGAVRGAILGTFWAAADCL
jgi:hypothetical protein